MQISNKKTYVKEIFTSIQGEGPFVGEAHTFIRFCRCNLNCKFCDTDFSFDNAKEYSSSELIAKLKNYDCTVLSLTGGEPLIEVDFLKEFLSEAKKQFNSKIYLETNGTLADELTRVIDFIDVVSMDIKLKSATGEKNRFSTNAEFLKIAAKNNKEVFVKVVFDNSITKEEINSVIETVKPYNKLIVLQPKMPLDYKTDFMNIFNEFYSKYKFCRLIPQVHKFLDVE